MPRSTTLLYLHGFLSSPQSRKAKLTVDYCRRTGVADKVLVPTLSWGPAAALIELREIIDCNRHEDFILIGSSLGGFYATFLAQEYSLPAALVNPAVSPSDYWESYLGEQKNYYTDEIHVVTAQHVKDLKQLEVSQISRPENLLLLVECGDETLDYRLAVAKYAQSQQIVRENGNHSYENYAADLPLIIQFLLSRIG